MSTDTLIKELQASGVKGRFAQNVELGKLSWFRCGGRADLVFQPQDEADLAAFLRIIPADMPLNIFGIGSNMLVRDGGIRGVVIRLSNKGFGGIVPHGSHQLLVGCAASDKSIAAAALTAGLGGFHFFHGIPGGLGGALRMNAGANNIETAERVIQVRAIDRQGKIHILESQDMGFSYRHCAASQDLIFISALLTGPSASADDISRAMAEVQHHRESVQPVREKTGGSTFRNPPQCSAWEAIDAAGCRGLTIGGAQMSPMHCNFMINTGEATAYDLELLGDTVRKRVYEHSGIHLHWEIKRIGDFSLGQSILKP